MLAYNWPIPHIIRWRVPAIARLATDADACRMLEPITHYANFFWSVSPLCSPDHDKTFLLNGRAKRVCRRSSTCAKVQHLGIISKETSEISNPTLLWSVKRETVMARN